jgi:hypothetical protein
MWARRMVTVVVLSLVASGLSLSHDRVVANEPDPATLEPGRVKPDSVPAKPVPVKPRSAGSDTKPAEKMRHPANGTPRRESHHPPAPHGHAHRQR